MKEGIPLKEGNLPKRFLRDPLADRGDGIQALAKRHARLFLRTNIWQRPPAWVTPLRDRKMLDWYAFSLYCRLIRRYKLLSALPDDSQPLDPIWLEGKPIVNESIQETDSEALARILYIAAFTDTLSFSHYLSNYIVEHIDRWNNRIHELAQTIPDEQQRRRSSVETWTSLVETTLFEFLIYPVPLERVIASEQPSWDAARAWRYFLCLEDRAMIGYWFGDVTAEAPSLLDVLSGLFLAYAPERYDESDPLDVYYHNNLIRVLGQDLYNRLSNMIWDFDFYSLLRPTQIVMDYFPERKGS